MVTLTYSVCSKATHDMLDVDPAVLLLCILVHCCVYISIRMQGLMELGIDTQRYSGQSFTEAPVGFPSQNTQSLCHHDQEFVAFCIYQVMSCQCKCLSCFVILGVSGQWCLFRLHGGKLCFCHQGLVMYGLPFEVLHYPKNEILS